MVTNGGESRVYTTDISIEANGNGWIKLVTEDTDDFIVRANASGSNLKK